MATESEEDTSTIFLLTFCTTVLLPWTLIKLTGASSDEAAAWRKLGFGADSEVVSCAVRRRPSRLKRHLTALNALYLVLVLAEGYLLLAGGAPAATFDPHEALGVDSGATQAEIRSAYRRLAATLHPDKNPDPRAHERFVEVAKAHKILTDDAAREAFERGAGQYQQVGFATPELLERPYVLGPLLLVVVCWPLLRLRSMGRESAAKQAAQAKAQQLYVGAALGGGSARQTASHPARQAARPSRESLLLALARAVAQPLPPALASLAGPLAAEAAELREADGQGGEEKRFGAELAAAEPAEAAAWSLLALHLARRELAAEWRPRLQALLEEAPSALQSFAEAAAAAEGFCEGGLDQPLGAVRDLAELRSCLTQAVPFRKPRPFDTLLQAPHFTPRAAVAVAAAMAAPAAEEAEVAAAGAEASFAEAAEAEAEAALMGTEAEGGGGAGRARHKRKGKKAGGKKRGSGGATASDAPDCGGSAVARLAALGDGARAALLSSAGLDGAQEAEVRSFCRVMPRPQLSARAYVEGEEEEGGETLPGDRLTVEVCLSLPHERAPGCPVHAPRSPPSAEAWLLCLSDAGGARLRGLVGVAAPPGAEHVAKFAIKVPGRAAGSSLRLEAHAFCCSYVGVDAQAQLAVPVGRG